MTPENPEELPVLNPSHPPAMPAASSVTLSAKQFDELLDAVRPETETAKEDPRTAGALGLSKSEVLAVNNSGMASDSEVTAPGVVPGYKTTEFWVTFTPTIVGLFLVALGVWKEHNILMMGGLGLLGIGQVPATTYNASRSKVKAAASAAKAQVLSNGPKVLPLLLALPLLQGCHLWKTVSTVEVNTAAVIPLAERVAERAVFAAPELADDWNELRDLLQASDTQPEQLLWPSTAALCAGHDVAVVEWWLAAPGLVWKDLPLSPWRVWNFMQQANSLRFSVGLAEVEIPDLFELEALSVSSETGG